MLDKSFDVHLNNNKNSRQHYIYEKKGLWNVCNILVRKWNVIVFLPCQFEKKVTISYHRHFDRNRIYFKNYLLRFIWEFGVESFIPCRMSLIFSNIVASSTCKMHWAQSFNSLTILAQNLLQTPPDPSQIFSPSGETRVLQRWGRVRRVKYLRYCLDSW